MFGKVFEVEVLSGQRMASDDLFPTKSVPAKMESKCGHDTVNKTKRKQKPLDAALLCSKLEVHQREQDAARLRREKRNAVRNGSYVPRSAAQSVAATSTPMRDLTNVAKPPKRRSAPAQFITEPLTMDGRICIPAGQRYAALNFGIGNSDVVGVPEEREVKPIKFHGYQSAEEVERDLKKLEERFPYRSASTREPSKPKEVTVIVAKESVPSKPGNHGPVVGDRKSSMQPTQAEHSKPTAHVKKASTESDDVTSPSAPRDVSPMGTDTIASEQAVERRPSVKAVKSPLPQEPEQEVSNSVEELLSLTEALSTAHDEDNEPERSEGRGSFKWDSYDPFKPQTRDSTKSEKRLSTKVESKRDSMNPVASDNHHLNAEERSTPQRRKSSPRTSPQKHTSPSFAAEERGRQRYRPGDAAKRRTFADPAPPVPWPVERIAAKDDLRPVSFHAITESRLSRFLEEDVSLDAPILEEDEPPMPTQRPKLVPHDRPDWSQNSQCGDDSRLTLNSLLPKSVRKTSGANRHSSILAPFAEPKAPEPKKYTGPQNDHLIADAVKIIQQQEKLKRRESLIGFFKKL